VAQLGMLRTASLMGKDKETAAAASALLKNGKTSPEVAEEATYFRAKSLLNMGQTGEAAKDLQTLSTDTRSIFGAEAQYMLAAMLFNGGEYEKARKQVQDFMKRGTPHQYWLAKALIVLSDCYAAEGDAFQAKQYIESLKANYKGAEEDIQYEINRRLN
jgi:TolA-binding protein